MTPGARIQAAIEILDRVVAGEPAERALTRWGRGARHAGSKDRAAVRDHVFDVLRRWWSSAALGGGEGGRARMLGLMRALDIDAARHFTGEGYAPAPLSSAERDLAASGNTTAVRDAPDWLLPELARSLGAELDPVLDLLRLRAPLFLRANLLRTTVEAAIAALADDGIGCWPHPLSPTALEVTANPRRVQQSRAYREGLVELQDAASQAVVDLVPVSGRERILDYCAGGGGKTLALAGRHRATCHAHDAEMRRMRDLPARAARAGVEVALRSSQALSKEPPYDLVVVDAPCSGSGAWRRSPEAKIRLTPPRLDDLRALQSRLLRDALGHLAPGGILAYMTCSLLHCENEAQLEALLAEHPLQVRTSRRLSPLDGGDGFYCAVIERR